MLAVAVALSSCGGGGDSGDVRSGEPPPPDQSFPPVPARRAVPTQPPAPAAGDITVTGRATYTSVPGGSGGALDYGAASDKPVRGASVQLIDAGNAVVAESSSDASGNFTLRARSTAAMPVRVRVLAELNGTDHYFVVRDNTDGSAMYAMDSVTFTTAAGTGTSQNVHAPSGWTGTAYRSAADRVAGPFSILDVAYLAKQKILAAAPGSSLPQLTLFWSPNNVASGGSLATGQIGTSFFTTTSADDRLLFLLGAENADTDEYDTPIVAHEIGHFLQSVISRDDSLGGQHSGGDRLDMRVAFSEGWGNAWSGMVRDDPVYFDTLGVRQAQGFSYNLASVPSLQGWYSEETVEYLLWNDYQDSGIGLAGIYAAMADMRDAPTFSSIFSFHEALRTARPGAAGSITSRATSVGVRGSDAYGSGETNNGGVTTAVPVYDNHNVALGTSKRYCVSSTQGGPNKLGNYVFVRFTASGTRTITVSRAAGTVNATDPDVEILSSQGQTVGVFDSPTANVETVSNVSLPTGTHVMAIRDYQLLDSGSTGTRCFDVTIN